MKAPKEVIDLLESILGIYFYDIKHKNRSTFILVDNLIELTIKIRLKQLNPALNVKIDFPSLLDKIKVSSKLKTKLLDNHTLRNEFQHKSPILTIDDEKCADSIILFIDFIKKIWGKNALMDIPNRVDCGLRLVKLHSSAGSIKKRKDFRDYILNNIDWNRVEIIEDERVFEDNRDGRRYNFYGPEGQALGKQIINKNELVIKIGSEEHWSYILRHYTDKVEECFNILSIDEL
ncbi:MAG: hypothetical protein MUF28_13515 [Ignavibacterium sp.]|jgi:hypothetical protein|nr:hypothetical protein [Ignavibacterium sp.]